MGPLKGASHFHKRGAAQNCTFSLDFRFANEIGQVRYVDSTNPETVRHTSQTEVQLRVTQFSSPFQFHFYSTCSPHYMYTHSSGTPHVNVRGTLCTSCTCPLVLAGALVALPRKVHNMCHRQRLPCQTGAHAQRTVIVQGSNIFYAHLIAKVVRREVHVFFACFGVTFQ